MSLHVAVPVGVCYFLYYDIYRSSAGMGRLFQLPYTVELRSIELEATVKICSSYWKVETTRSHNFREKKIWFWPGTVSLRYDNWCTVKWAFLVLNKYLILLKVLKVYACEYLFGIFKRSLETFISLCSRSIW
jgi:hypothetical protein